MARQKLQRVTTPVGIAHYPHLKTPDEYKGVRKYKCGLILNGDDPFINVVREASDKAFEQAKAKLSEDIESGELKGKKLAAAKAELDNVTVNYPFEDEYNDEGEPTGRIVIKTSANAAYKGKDGKEKPIRINVFDSQGAKITCPDIWGGSELRLAVDLNPYHMTATSLAGVSLRLSGVQIIELNSGGGGSAEDMGFGAVEGGYTAPAASDDDEPFADTDEDDDDGDF